MKPASLNTSIHRTLLLRLTAATIVLCLLFAALAFTTNQRRIEQEVVQLAQLRTGQFARSIQDLLDSQDQLTTSNLERRLDEFRQKTGLAVINAGHFVLVRIYDRNGRLVLDSADENFAALPVVRQAIEGKEVTSKEVASLGPDDFRVVTKRLEGQPFIGIAVPLNNSDHQAVAQIVGVFAISPATIDTIRGNILKTLLYVVGLILTTALVIYPIIGRLLNRLSRQTVKLLDSNLEILSVLGGAIAKRDSDTDTHNYRVSVFSVLLAEAVNLPRDQIRSLIKGAMLHDVGKLGIRDNILLKPGKLTDDEFTVMKTHVEHGIEITDRANWLADAQAVVSGHHEKYDGAGYPAGLKAEEIPIAARIFAITDVFDALTSKRPYKEPMTFEETMQILESGRNSHFDPALIDAFSPIARELYDTYSGKDDHKPRERLNTMLDQYFKRNIADLLS
jgi:HD-GYP domain-containing protein (c-di-GMP phosphodiesterase class II)